MKDIERIVESYMLSHGMLREDSRIVLAVSGGADSVCLVLLLCALRARCGLTLFAVHVNHGIRGGEADGDEAFVKELAEQYGIPFRAYHENVPRLAEEEGLTVEEAGRTARRRDLLDAKTYFRADRIATAHHLDDQAETVLLMLCRGSGLAGAAGIAPADKDFIRPLLCVSRAQITDYLVRCGQGWREDRTNGEDAYARNRLRHHVLPYLAGEINTASAEHIAYAADSVREALGYMREQAEQALADVYGKEGRRCPLPEAVLASPPALQPYIVQSVLLKETGTLRDITRDHIRALLALLGGRTGARVDLPGALAAVKEYEGVFFYPKETDGCAGTVKGIPLATGGSVLAGPWIFRCTAEPFPPRPVPEKNYTKWIDSDIIAQSLCVRTRREGDFLTVTDDGKRKSLSDYLIDEKVPRGRRDSMLLVADGSEIVWIPGKRLGARYKITENTVRALCLAVKEAAPQSGAAFVCAEGK